MDATKEEAGLPSVRMIDAVWACQIADYLAAKDVDADRVLASVDVDKNRIRRDKARIPYVRHAALLEAAATASGDDCFGLHFGASVDFRDTGLIAYVGSSSPTLGAAVGNLVRYLRVFTEGVELKVLRRAEVIEVHIEIIDPGARGNRQVMEFGFTQFRRALEIFSGRPIFPEWIEFRHGRAENIVEFERVLGAPVYFNRERNLIALHRRHLSLPLASADDRLLKVLKGYCDEILARRQIGQDLAYDVERQITSLLPSGRATLDVVAAELGMSKRTLSRRLAERGTSFGAALDGLRRDLAERYLEDSDFTLGHIAYLLGYSEVSAFNHAFRRWTGSSPARHRSVRLGRLRGPAAAA